MGDSSSTGGYLQHGGHCSVKWRDNISTVGDNIHTVAGVQYIGGIKSVHAGG